MARARNDGTLFAEIEWPRDPEIVRIFEHKQVQDDAILVFDSFVFLGTEGAGEASAPPSHC